METFNPLFVSRYDPLKAGSIDGTDEVPHDKAIMRAIGVKFRLKNTPGDPECTVFIGRLNPTTSEQTIQRALREFGAVQRVQVVRDTVTGFSKCYAFVEFEDSYQARSAIRSGNKMVIDDHEVLMDSEKSRSLKGWVPRRFGGGLGGKRESGQLRFGGRDRPFSKPIMRLDDKTRRDHTADNERLSRYSRNRFDAERSHQRSRSRSRDRGSYSHSYGSGSKSRHR